MKFGRQCTLTVDVDGGDHVDISSDMQDGLTVEFYIDRQGIASANNARFVINNLREATRNRIRKDAFALTEYRALQFRAGYAQFNPLAFNGNVKQAYSEHGSGAVEWRTVIEGQDGAFPMVNGLTSRAYASGTSTRSVLTELASSLPGIASNPIVGLFDTVSMRGIALVGNTWDHIGQLSGGAAIIDNSQVKILQPSEAVQGEILLINAASGLLGAPRRADNKIEFDMLFEPRLTLGQTIVLESESNRVVNGTYKVMGLTHRGTVSPAVSGEDCITTVSLWIPAAGPFITLPGAPVQ